MDRQIKHNKTNEEQRNHHFDMKCDNYTHNLHNARTEFMKKHNLNEMISDRLQKI